MLSKCKIWDFRVPPGLAEANEHIALSSEDEFSLKICTELVVAEFGQIKKSVLLGDEIKAAALTEKLGTLDLFQEDELLVILNAHKLDAQCSDYLANME